MCISSARAATVMLSKSTPAMWNPLWRSQHERRKPGQLPWQAGSAPAPQDVLLHLESALSGPQAIMSWHMMGPVSSLRTKVGSAASTPRGDVATKECI